MALERFPVPPGFSFPLCPHAAPPGLEVSSPRFPSAIALLGLTLSPQPPPLTDSAKVMVTHKCICGKGGGHPPGGRLEPHSWACWGPRR